MKTYDLLEEMSALDPELILKAAPAETPQAKRRRVNAKRWGVLAAACLLLCAFFGVQHFASRDGASDPLSTYFILKANAADGTSKELKQDELCFNSGTSNANIFGVDHPLFDFCFEPFDWQENEELYSKIVVSLSYHDKEVGAGDKHVALMHYYITVKDNLNEDGTLKDPENQGAHGYAVIGWFTEPTDLVVTFSHKDTGEILEEFILRISYRSDIKAYELTLTDRRTVVECFFTPTNKHPVTRAIKHTDLFRYASFFL